MVSLKWDSAKGVLEGLLLAILEIYRGVIVSGVHKLRNQKPESGGKRMPF